MKNRRGDEGLAMVELAIVILLLIMLTFGAMEYGWLFFNMHQVNNAARSGARQGVLPDSNNAKVVEVVQSTLGNESFTLTTEPGDVTEIPSGELLEVTVVVNHSPLTGLPFLPTPSELSASVAMAKEGPA